MNKNREYVLYLFALFPLLFLSHFILHSPRLLFTHTPSDGDFRLFRRVDRPSYLDHPGFSMVQGFLFKRL